MNGVSRASHADLRERLTVTVTGQAVAEATGGELFAVVRLLDAEHGLRRALSDPAKSAAEKGAVVRALLHGKTAPGTEHLVAEAVASHWSGPNDLADAIEQLAIECYAMAAQYEGSLDDLEDSLFRFSRTISAEPALRSALAGTAGEGAKRGLLRSLLAGKVEASTLTLITEIVTHPRGRSPQAALDLAAGIAAHRREQLVAVVRAAGPLTSDQRRRLRTALADAYGKGVHLNVVLDPDVVGGISVQIGDELIDGTAASRLAEVRRRLAG